MKQLHKKFNTEQVKEALSNYDKNGFTRKYIQESLGISKTRFFELIKEYRQNPEDFDITYTRKYVNKIGSETEALIQEELTKEYALIHNPNIPVFRYNYAFISEKLAKQGIKISATTVGQRAKEWGFYKDKLSAHTRTITSKSAGELIQIDCHNALYAPASKKAYYLSAITDDYSRFILDAKLTETENVEEIIKSLATVFETHGFPKKYYHSSVAGETVMKLFRDCQISKIADLHIYSCFNKSREYLLLQENLSRECIDKNIADIAEAQKILNRLVEKHNYKTINTVSQELPYLRFKSRDNVWRVRY